MKSEERLELRQVAAQMPRRGGGHGPGVGMEARVGKVNALVEGVCSVGYLTQHAVAVNTLTITVRDRSAEGEWGHSYRGPVTRRVTIAASCPVCGQPRGEARGLNQYDDGDHYWVQVWDNPCGHHDSYVAVIKEAAALHSAGAAI